MLSRTYKERQRKRVNFPECGKYLTSGHFLCIAKLSTAWRRGDWCKRVMETEGETSP